VLSASARKWRGERSERTLDDRNQAQSRRGHHRRVRRSLRGCLCHTRNTARRALKIGIAHDIHAAAPEIDNRHFGFPDGHLFRHIRAMPADVALPPIHLLGSSGYSAELAAVIGAGFAFALRDPRCRRSHDELPHPVPPLGGAGASPCDPRRCRGADTQYGMGLGPVHTVPLSLAREKARAARLQLLDGVNPLVARRSARAQAAAATAKAITFGEAAQSYFDGNSSSWKSAKHTSQWMQSVLGKTASCRPSDPKHDHCGALRQFPIADIDTGAVLKVVEPMWSTTPETARVRHRARLSQRSKSGAVEESSRQDFAEEKQSGTDAAVGQCRSGTPVFDPDGGPEWRSSRAPVERNKRRRGHMDDSG
jgi:hypothetical protein